MTPFETSNEAGISRVYRLLIVRRRWPSIARKLSRLLTEEVERIEGGELKRERGEGEERTGKA